MNPPQNSDFELERRWLEPLLRERIPLAGTMDLRIARLDQHGIRLDFPLAPSVNDKGTAFGGALASAMILAGWSLPRLLLKRQALTAELVIGRCELRFLLPVHCGFSASCHWPDDRSRSRFLAELQDHGKGRLEVLAEIEVDGQCAASLQARYAALSPAGVDRSPVSLT